MPIDLEKFNEDTRRKYDDFIELLDLVKEGVEKIGLIQRDVRDL